MDKIIIFLNSLREFLPFPYFGELDGIIQEAEIAKGKIESYEARENQPTPTEE